MIQITNEDNLELMKRYPDNYFDLAIVDPPYGIDAGKMTMGSGKHNFKKVKIGIAQSHLKNILTNYLGFQKIKLYGVEIIFLYH